jgi:hypothetical protein
MQNKKGRNHFKRILKFMDPKKYLHIDVSAIIKNGTNSSQLTAS